MARVMKLPAAAVLQYRAHKAVGGIRDCNTTRFSSSVCALATFVSLFFVQYHGGGKEVSETFRVGGEVDTTDSSDRKSDSGRPVMGGGGGAGHRGVVSARGPRGRNWQDRSGAKEGSEEDRGIKKPKENKAADLANSWR